MRKFREALTYCFKPVVPNEVGNSGIYLKAPSNKAGIFTVYMIVVVVACARLSKYLRRRENKPSENKTCIEPMLRAFFASVGHDLCPDMEQTIGVLVAPGETYVPSILRSN